MAVADTDYATKAELKERIAVEDANALSDTMLQQLLNSSAYIVDQNARNPPGCERMPVGAIAFSESASGTRYFDDDGSGVVPIDDLLSVTSVTRGGVEVLAANYKLWPYNAGTGPRTRLLFLPSALLGLTYILPVASYGYPLKGVGAGEISITGTWGYCDVADRPAIVKEATLTQAKKLYERMGLSPSELVAGYRDPYKTIDPLVLAMLAPVIYDIPTVQYPPING